MVAMAVLFCLQKSYLFTDGSAFNVIHDQISINL